LPYNYGIYEIFTGNDEVPNELAHSRVPRALCTKCGIRIHFIGIDLTTHTKWHEEIDELVDWARSVSDLFKRPEPDASEDKRRISSEHAGQHEASIKDRFDTGSSEEGLQKGSE
jgi:hypothetical protein